MLRNIHPLLTPDILYALDSAGHGDRVAIVDANFPAAATGRRLVRTPGITATAMLDAVLSLLPIDDFIPEPVAVMQVAGDPSATPEVVAEFTTVLQRNRLGAPARLERYEFYRAAAEAFLIIQTGERRLYGNILLRKGAIRP
jgi:L-fucose mutarotase